MRLVWKIIMAVSLAPLAGWVVSLLFHFFYYGGFFVWEFASNLPLLIADVSV
jgi:hypothetical protein